ncbi:hypothetical protein VNI00_011252 [Paramarasmius palmivorus]|uniref:N-acetyltransferase domain-containing protein n=1 Tax=Paramarasmius palmivorus TaxID=297713 RepID=A0AAW0CE48_9AGAR
MSSYQIAPIPSPPSSSQVEQYKSFRLLSLELDPGSFSSKYADEVKFTDEQWQERLSGFGGRKVTIAATTTEGNWVGMITVLSPQFIDFTYYIPSQVKAMRSVEEMYIVVGMWVHPEHRRKGLGGRLVKQAAEWAKDREMEKDSGTKKAALLLEVLLTNNDAIALYSKTGFVKIETEEIKTEGCQFMYLDIA